MLITLGVVVAVCFGGSVIAAVASGGSGDSGGDDKPTATATEAGKTSSEKPEEKTAAEKPEGEKGQFGMKPGTKVTLSADDTEQAVTVKSLKAHKKGCGSFAVDPEKGTFVVVDVSVESLKGEVSVNPLYFTWVTAEGTTTDALSGAFSGCEKDSLDSTELRAGQKRSGQIVFDVPSAKGSVEISPVAFSGAAASWTFS